MLLGVLVLLAFAGLAALVLLQWSIWEPWMGHSTLEQGGEEVPLSPHSSGSPRIPRLEGTYGREAHGCSAPEDIFTVGQHDVFLVLSGESDGSQLQLPMMLLLPMPVQGPDLSEKLPLLALQSSGSPAAKKLRTALLEGEFALCFLWLPFFFLDEGDAERGEGMGNGGERYKQNRSKSPQGTLFGTRPALALPYWTERTGRCGRCQCDWECWVTGSWSPPCCTPAPPLPPLRHRPPPTGRGRGKATPRRR